MNNLSNDNGIQKYRNKTTENKYLQSNELQI